MLNYRKATTSDLPFMIDIERKSFNEIDRFKIYQIKHFLNNKNQSIITDIILKDNVPVGWAAYFTRKNSSGVRLYTFCIDPAFRGKGFGKEYLKLRIGEFKRNFRKITLEVRESNHSAVKLYENLGFKKRKILKNYYLDEDGIKMELCF